MRLELYPYEIVVLNTDELIVPRGTYQRELRSARVREIASKFDPCVANEPKVSFRNGRYYVFDGQHTIAALILLNGGKPLAIRCRVYHNLTEQKEAELFAEQFGEAATVAPGAKLRALIFAGDAEAIGFQKVTESVGFRLSMGQAKTCSGKEKSIACVATAFDEYKRVGAAIYAEALKIVMDAWNGDPDSVRAETLQGVIRFVELYHGEYDAKRLITRLKRVSPLVIYRNGRESTTLMGYKKYLNQVYQIYNGSAKRAALPMKF